MAFLTENMGVGFLNEKEENLNAFINTAIAGGEVITGYYDNPYFNFYLGNCQFVIDAEIEHEREEMHVKDLNAHCEGNTVWEVRLTGMDFTPKNDSKMGKTLVVSRLSGEGLAVVKVLNADVLPSFTSDDVVKLQMAAFPEDFDYFDNEDEYCASVSEDDLGRKFLLDEGMVFPTGMMNNRTPDNENAEENSWMDSCAYLRGKVKRAYCGKVRLGEEEHDAFIRCIIETKFGDLMIVHTYDQIKEDQRKNLREGAIFVGACALTGDAAIYEYEKGIVRDEKNNLRLLRYTFAGHDPERLRTVLADDVQYSSETSGKTVSGKDDVIDRVKYVQENTKVKYFAHLSSIISVDDGEEELPYDVGTNCIVLAADDEHNYESIVFMDMDGDGNIKNINVSQNGRYHFRIDDIPEPEMPFAYGDVPESFLSAIVSRAKYLGFLQNDYTDDYILSMTQDAMLEKDIAGKVLAVNKDGKLENVFGYMFAKGMELEYARMNPDVSSEFDYDNAWNGDLNTEAPDGIAEKLRTAMKHGRSFHVDYEVHSPELSEALMLMHRLGEASAQFFLSEK